MKGEKRLTPKQKMFVQETVLTLNPTEAVRRVYALGSKGGVGLNDTAKEIASQNMRKQKIITAFAEKLALLDDSAIVEEFYRIALGNNDLRAKIQAGIEVLKLKQRYPKETIDLELSLKRKNLIEV